jgi:protein-tyrosine phosphatase
MDAAPLLPGTHNARELGGLPTADGGHVAYGVLYRSDALAGLTDAGIVDLLERGIGTVVDLRTDGERARAADRLPIDGSVRLVALPVLGGAMDELAKQLLPTGQAAALSPEQIADVMEQVPTLEALYAGILSSSAPQFAALSRAVVAAASTDRPGVVFHCTAGKDRTGIAAALLLQLAGASRDVIVADYVVTAQCLAGGLAAALTAIIAGLGIPLTPRLRTLATESPAAAIESALDWIEAEHGDAAGYLRSGGLKQAEIDDLRLVLRAA